MINLILIQNKVNGLHLLNQKYKRPIKLLFDFIDKKNNKKILKKGEKLNFVLAKKLKEKGLKEILVSPDELIGKYTKKILKIKMVK